MATTKDIYLHIHLGIVIGYASETPNPTILPKDEEFVKITTANDPNKYIGLTKVQALVPEPVWPEPDPTNKTAKAYKRRKLYALWYELQFTAELGQDTTALQTEYDTLKADYLTP